MLWLRVVVALIAVVTLGVAFEVVRRAGASDRVNRRRAYFTGASYLLIGVCIAALAVWPTAYLGYAIGGVVLAELLVAPRLGPRRL